MIHNRYMEMSNIPGQDRGFGPHTEPLKFAPCPARRHVSLCSSEVGGVCSGQHVQRSLILSGLECCRAPCSPPFKSQSQRVSD